MAFSPVPAASPRKAARDVEVASSRAPFGKRDAHADTLVGPCIALDLPLCADLLGAPAPLAAPPYNGVGNGIRIN